MTKDEFNGLYTMLTTGNGDLVYEMLEGFNYSLEQFLLDSESLWYKEPFGNSSSIIIKTIRLARYNSMFIVDDSTITRSPDVCLEVFHYSDNDKTQKYKLAVNYFIRTIKEYGKP